MNLLRLIDSIDESTLKSKEAVNDLRSKIADKNLLIGCEYNLFKALTDILQIQEKVEFFLEMIGQCNFDKMNEKDFSVFMHAMADEYLRKVEFHKKCINEEKLVK